MGGKHGHILSQGAFHQLDGAAQLLVGALDFPVKPDNPDLEPSYDEQANYTGQ